MKKQTLLYRYLNYELERYVEPSRKGTPRGEMVGLSKKKFTAALLTGLTNLPWKEIAGRLGTSQGMLKKWCIEPEYKKTVEKHRKALASMIVTYLKGRIKETKMAEGGGVVNEETYRERLSIVRNELPLRELQDANELNRDVIIEIFQQCRELSTKESLVLFGFLHVIFFRFGLISAEKFQELHNLRKQSIKPILEKTIPVLVDDIRHFLGKKKLNEAEKLTAFSLLDIIEVYLSL